MKMLFSLGIVAVDTTLRTGDKAQHEVLVNWGLLMKICIDTNRAPDAAEESGNCKYDASVVTKKGNSGADGDQVMKL